MFTLEIAGTAIVVTNAAEAEARELLDSEDFKEDLKTLTADGRPLWDGTAPLTIRPASEDEIDAFDEALNDESYEDEDPTDDDDDAIDVVFLIEVDGTEEDEDDAASA
jgi:hypothetical protein